MKLLKREEGVALITAVMVMVVLSILGTALWQYSTSDTIHVDRDEKRMRAYYLARAGADAALQAWYESDPDSRVTGTSDTMYLDGETGHFVSEVPEKEEGRFAVNISEEGEAILIKSTGEVEGITQEVTVALSPYYQYGHDLGWYDETSGQINEGTFGHVEGAVRLKAQSEGGNLMSLKEPSNNTAYFKADALFVESPLGMPMNDRLDLEAELIRFHEEIGFHQNKGELYLHVPEGEEKGTVIFDEVSYGNNEQFLSYKAYDFYETISVHELRSEGDVQKLIDEDKLVLIPEQEAVFPWEMFKVVWS